MENSIQCIVINYNGKYFKNKKSESLCCTPGINKIVNQLFFKKTYSQLLPKENEKKKEKANSDIITYLFRTERKFPAAAFLNLL